MNSMAYGRDSEIVQRLKPEPMTLEEQAAQPQIDDVDFEIFMHKINMIALEGKETTMKLGASTGMRWGDVAFGLYTARGDLAVVATGIWFHAVLGQIPVKYIVKHWVKEPSVGVREGDSFFFNDPYYCGVHAADMGLCVPVFYGDKLVCFTGAVVHTGESGGIEPGGMSCNSRSKYHEGLLVPPIKIGENYALKEDVLTMLANMTRDPRTLILDIKARLAASRIAQRRIIELMENKGVEFFIGALRRILTITGAGARPDMDGVNGAGSFFATMSDCSDVETTESDKPFLYLFRNYCKHSYGHGKFRGGAGVGFGLMMHHVSWVAMGSFGYGSKFPATLGIFGGYAAPPVFVQTVRGSNVKALLAEGNTSLPAHIDQMYESENPEEGQREFHHITLPVEPLMNGDTFYGLIGGGAGYGDVLERDPEKVLVDLGNGLVTHWAARNLYQVAYDEQTMRLDPEKTEALRNEARAERKKRGRPYAEFEAEWLKLRPPGKVIKYYGTYPHPSGLNGRELVHKL